MIGQSSIRKEGRGKVTGLACYTDDRLVPGALYGVTIRSRPARGILRGIGFGPGIPWEQFTVVTAARACSSSQRSGWASSSTGCSACWIGSPMPTRNG